MRSMVARGTALRPGLAPSETIRPWTASSSWEFKDGVATESITPPSLESLISETSTVRVTRDTSNTTRVVPRSLERVVTTAALATKRPDVAVDSMVLQIWEGVVKHADFKASEMDVVLTAKVGREQPHTAQISLQWVPEQDFDLVRPGAVFYLTLYKRTQRGTIQNAQELRFRRRPAWSRTQVLRIRREAERLGTKICERPSAE